MVSDSTQSTNATSTRAVAQEHGSQLSLALGDFASLFGITASELPSQCREIVLSSDFTYRVPEKKEMDRILLKIMKMVDENQPIVRSERSNNRSWNRVWSESLSDLKEKGGSLDATVPPYFTAPEFMRLKREYIIANDPQFFMNVYTIYRIWAFIKFLSEYDAIYEFGCGSCNNLSLLARLFPGKRLIGLDIASPPMEMIQHLAVTQKWKVEGRRFDMFRPDYSLSIGPKSAVLTVTALEQIGPRHESFLQFLLQQCPDVCVHLEPIVEWYDDNQLADYLTLRYHRNHGYLEGFWSRLKDLEALGRVEIIEARRLEFGGYHDACSLLVWRPRAERREKKRIAFKSRFSRLIGRAQKTASIRN